MSSNDEVVVGITGASGAAVGLSLLKALRVEGHVTHLIVTPWGARTLKHETGIGVNELSGLATFVHRPSDLGATVSSGSYGARRMIIAPCSMRSLAAIANGFSEDLLTRAADVVIKEGGRLVLGVRETPLSPIHLDNMLKVSRLGVSICPPVIGMYTKPKTVQDMIDHIVMRMLDQLGIATTGTRWAGLN